MTEPAGSRPPVTTSGPPSSGGRLVRNLGVLAMASALTKAAVFGTNLAVGRLLGPEQFGEFTAAQTVAMVGSLLADLGLTVATTGDIVRDRNRFSRSICTTLAVQTLAATVFTVLLAAGVLLAGDRPGTQTLVLLMLPLPIALAVNMTYALQAVEDMKRVAAARVITVLVTTSGGVATAAAMSSAKGPAVMAWVGIIVGDVVVVRWLWRRHGFRPVRVRLRDGIDLIRRSGSTTFNSALLVVFLAVDTLSLAVFASSRQVGYYAVAWSTVFSVQALVLLVTDATYPDMIRRWMGGQSRLRSLVDRLCVLILRPAFAGAALISVCAPALVRLALGPQYAETATVLRLVVWLIPFGATALLLSFSILAADRPRLLLKRRILIVGAALVGCPVAAASGGATAVAAVILGCSVFELILFGELAHRLRTASVATSLLRQVDYFLVPFAVLMAESELARRVPLGLAVGSWLLATGVVELTRRGSTIRTVLSVIGAGHVTSRRSTEDRERQS